MCLLFLDRERPESEGEGYKFFILQGDKLSSAVLITPLLKKNCWLNERDYREVLPTTPTFLSTAISNSPYPYGWHILTCNCDLKSYKQWLNYYHYTGTKIVCHKISYRGAQAIGYIEVNNDPVVCVVATEMLIGERVEV